MLGLQLVKRSWTRAMPASYLRGRHLGLLLLDHPDNLRLGETAFPHSSALAVEQSRHQVKGSGGGAVQRHYEEHRHDNEEFR